MALSGRANGPALGPPVGLVDRVVGLSATLTDQAAALGAHLVVDGLALLGERAALAGFERRGTTSCGGAAKILATRDGWLAVSLPRPDDRELVPAWLGLGRRAAERQGPDLWTEVTRNVARRPTAELVDWGAALGLAVGGLPVPLTQPHSPVVAHRITQAGPTTGLDELLVVDLSSLWAGPLCGSLLADCGATVIKVESTGRPDGSRQGPVGFFDLMNAGKRSTALDLTSAAGHRGLEDLLRTADVVIEGSRPRALEQMGIDAAEVIADDGPRAWVSITGHGRGPDERERVGFGDDAAVAGGLVVWDGDEPLFCADAVADPLSGLVAAKAVLGHLRQGGRWLLDVSLSRTAAWCSGPTLPVAGSMAVAPPRARPLRLRTRSESHSPGRTPPPDPRLT